MSECYEYTPTLLKYGPQTIACSLNVGEEGGEELVLIPKMPQWLRAR